MLNKEFIDRILNELKELRARTNMYVHPASPESLFTFLGGFTRGLLICNTAVRFDNYVTTYRNTRVNLGWEDTARAVFKEMREKNMSEDSIVIAMIDIEVEVWKALGE